MGGGKIGKNPIFNFFNFSSDFDGVFFHWNPCEKLNVKSFYEISLTLTVFEKNGVKGAKKGNFC
jgi:hypothetical protein